MCLDASTYLLRIYVLFDLFSLALLRITALHCNIRCSDKHISSNTSNERFGFIGYCKEQSDQRLVRRQSEPSALHIVCRLYHQTILEEQVLLSSLLLAHHTHTQEPYSELVLCANGSRFRGCHPFHFLLSVLSQPLRLAQTLTSLPIFQDKRMSLQWDFV